MFTCSNVVLFPLKKRKIRRDLMETPPYPWVIKQEQITCFVSDGLNLPEKRVEYMERYIRKHALIASILMDERGEIIDGLDLVKRYRKAKGGVMVFVVPFTRRQDKEALQQAYQNLRNGGAQ